MLFLFIWSFDPIFTTGLQAVDDCSSICVREAPPVPWGWSLPAFIAGGSPEWHMRFCGESLTWKPNKNKEKRWPYTCLHAHKMVLLFVDTFWCGWGNYIPESPLMPAATITFPIYVFWNILCIDLMSPFPSLTWRFHVQVSSNCRCQGPTFLDAFSQGQPLGSQIGAASRWVQYSQPCLG